MLDNITLGQYFPGDSLLHKLDPRTKIILVTTLIVLIFVVKTYVGYLLLYGVLFILMLISTIPIKHMLKGLKPLMFIIIFTFIINIFFNSEGAIIFEYRFVKITDVGLILAVKLCLRLIYLILTSTLLTYTTSPIKLTDAIESLFKPLKKIKFPVHEIAMMMTIAIRFIPTLIKETDKIMKAQMARGADFESKNIFKKAADMVPLLVPLFVSAFRRADELAFAMEARCYNGGHGRTKLNPLKMKSLDIYTFIATGVVITLVCFGI